MSAVCFFLRMWYGVKSPAACDFPFGRFDGVGDDAVLQEFSTYLDGWASEHPDAVREYERRRQAEDEARRKEYRARDAGQVHVSGVPRRARPEKPRGVPSESYVVRMSRAKSGAVSWQVDVRERHTKEARILDAAGWLSRNSVGFVFDIGAPPVGPSQRYWFGWTDDESAVATTLRILARKIPPTMPTVHIGTVSAEQLERAETYEIDERVEYLLDEHSGAATGEKAGEFPNLQMRMVAKLDPYRWRSPPAMPAGKEMRELLVVLAAETERIKARFSSAPEEATDAETPQGSSSGVVSNAPPRGDDAECAATSRYDTSCGGASASSSVKIHDFERRAAESFAWALRVHPALEEVPKQRRTSAAYKKVLDGAKAGTCSCYDAKHPVPGKRETWAKYARDGLRKLGLTNTPDAGSGSAAGAEPDDGDG